MHTLGHLRLQMYWKTAELARNQRELLSPESMDRI